MQESNFIERWNDPLSSSNLGHQMLLRMGWKPGQGLGPHGDGIREPVTVPFRPPQLGIDGDESLFDEDHYEKALS
jgi:hypothetical protein